MSSTVIVIAIKTPLTTDQCNPRLLSFSEIVHGTWLKTNVFRSSSVTTNIQ